MALPMTSPLLTLSNLEKSKSLGFQSLIPRKGAELGPMLLLTVHRKPYMASSITLSVLLLNDLERSLGFQCLISHKGAELGPMVLLTISRKLFMASSMTLSLLIVSDLER